MKQTDSIEFKYFDKYPASQQQMSLVDQIKMSSKYLSLTPCDHLWQIRCNFSLRLSNYQLESIYDKRFFVKILKVFYQDKKNGQQE